MICFGCGDDISSRSSERRLLDSPSSSDVLNIWKELFKKGVNFLGEFALEFRQSDWSANILQYKYDMRLSPDPSSSKQRGGNARLGYTSSQTGSCKITAL